MDELVRNRRLVALEQAFRPAGPVNREDLFSGRRQQLSYVSQAQATVGQHAVIYGERGVGKTSLAAVSAEMLSPRGVNTMRINCDAGDNFAALWNKVVEEFPVYQASIDSAEKADSFAVASERATEVLQYNNEIGPSQARLALRHLATAGPPVIIFDEFDQLIDTETVRLMSNTIKTLSDQLETATLIIVGVADNVEQLIVGHKSIERAVLQIEMPRMSADELREIAVRGLASVEMTIEDRALHLLGFLPHGLPQYAHLMTQEGARHCLYESREVVTSADLIHGMNEGLNRVQHSIVRAYHEAITTPQQKTNTFPSVLLACAMSSVDDLGFFQPADIKDTYSRVRKKAQDIPNFNPQLTQLAQGRGKVLERVGEERRWRYRFSDPLMEPYVIMRGMLDGMITPDDF